MSFFGEFGHLIEHVAREVGSLGLGFPPGAITAATELVTRAHAGDRHAQAKMMRVAQRHPDMKHLFVHVSRRLRAHPHYAHLRRYGQHSLHPRPAWTHAGHGIESSPLPPGAHDYVVASPDRPAYASGAAHGFPAHGHAWRGHAHHGQVSHPLGWEAEFLRDEAEELETLLGPDDGEPEPGARGI